MLLFLNLRKELKLVTQSHFVNKVKIPNCSRSSAPVIKKSKSRRNPVHSLKLKDVLWVSKGRTSNQGISHPCDSGPIVQAKTHSSQSNSMEEELRGTIKIGEGIGYKVQGHSEQLRSLVSGDGINRVVK